MGFLEWGHIKVDQQKKSYDFTIKSAKVFATCNDVTHLSKPLRSRFRTIFLQRYTEQQFLNIAVKVLPKTSESIARYIGTKIYQTNGDIRQVISFWRLIQKDDGSEAIEMIMNTLAKYSESDKK